jgi:hypothetical protein
MIHMGKGPLFNRCDDGYSRRLFSPAFLLLDNIAVKTKEDGGRADRSRP